MIEQEKLEQIAELVKQIQSVQANKAKLIHYSEAEGMFISCNGMSCNIKLTPEEQAHVITELTDKFDDAETALIDELENILES